MRLLASSRIYVSKIALKNATTSANGPNSLARKLMFAVFTNNALMECNASQYGNAATGRKMLNQKGIKTILRFVKNYTLRRKRSSWLGHPKAEWTDDHYKRLKRSITKKCNEMKREKKLNLKFNIPQKLVS